MKLTHAFVIAVCVGLAGCLDYSDGDRIGTVVKLSKKGFFCKTWEGQMYLGGLKKHTNSDGNTSMVANTWDFTVEDASYVPALQKALETGTPIKVRYNQEFATFCRSDSENYFITGVASGSAPPVPN